MKCVPAAMLCAMLGAACFQPDPEDLAGLRQAASGPTAATTDEANDEASADEPAIPEAANEPSVTYDCVSPEQGPYHPPGYADEKLHGPDTKRGTEDCRTCHGDQLQGCEGAVGCDNCHDGGHPDGWRERCTYCHGGRDNETGAPPTDLDRMKPSGALSFLAHGAHVEGELHVAFDCTQCHVKPDGLLSDGHMFDETPGVAEVSFADGLSPKGIYQGEGSCAELYCHGNGRRPGELEDSAGQMACTSCHGYFEEPDNLTPTHAAHFDPAIPLFEAVLDCSECHAPVIEEDDAGVRRFVGGLEAHVNGRVDLALPTDPNGDNMVAEYRQDGSLRCNGTCHGADHNPLGIGDAIGFGVWQFEE